MTRGRVPLSCVWAVGAVLYGAPQDAEACGGTFCDAGPQAMPVEQTGETVLFVLDGDRLETHIQIRYDPDTEAERFAWVIPVMEIPTFSVGSQALFDGLLGATAPRHGFTTTAEPCPAPPTDPCSGDDDAVKLDVGGGPSGGVDEPEVVEHALVGAFEIAVLDGGTAEGVFAWLIAEEFAIDENATPILHDYIERGFKFVALKLATGAGADEVHPIVLEQHDTEPCVPIILTRIATRDDLELRTLFLADARVVPDNYAHVVLNPLKLDWLGTGSNYRELVTLAVDEATGPAGGPPTGHGFVTEYSGTIPAIDPELLVDPRWNAEAFREAEWVAAAYMFADQFLDCWQPDTCTTRHALAESVQSRWLPIPEGVSAQAFWTCPECFASVFDEAAWDGPAFADALADRIVDPGIRARELLRAWPWLTRMVTTLSEHEMTRDPTFVINPDAPLQETTTFLGRRVLTCDGTESFVVPDGRSVAVPGSSWPDVGGEDMPWAARIEHWGPVGAPIVSTDNSLRIDALLREHNERHGLVVPPDALCGAETTGIGEPWADVPLLDGARDRGCACTLAPDPPGGARWLAWIFGIPLARRRRQAPSPRPASSDRVGPTG
jgi:MYXO-CTERM domain-containing protein